MRRLSMVLGLSFFGFAIPCGSAPKRIVVEKGVQVEPIQLYHKWRKETKREKWNLSGGDAGMFLNDRGLFLATVVYYEMGKILEFPAEEIQVDQFHDDLGTSLMGKDSKFQVWPHTDSSDEMVRLYFDTKAVPGPGASAIEVKGSAIVRYASELKSMVSKPIKVVPGSAPKRGGGGHDGGKVTLNLGEHKLQVRFGPRETRRTSVALVAAPSHQFIHEFQFLAEDGSVIKHQQTGSGSGGEERSRLISYSLEGSHRQIKIAVKYWTGIGKKRLRFDFKTGLSLAAGNADGQKAKEE